MNKIISLLVFVLLLGTAFVAGMNFNSFYSKDMAGDNLKEKPYSQEMTALADSDKYSTINDSNNEKLSPYNNIQDEQINVFPDKLILNVKEISLASYADTNSMDPVLDEGATGLEIVPKNEDNIHVGDIISYKSIFNDGLIVHRIVEKGVDERGTYFILKGDNNAIRDIEKVRFGQIKGVLVGIFY